MLPAGRLCLHTPCADCNEERRNAMKYLHLCLHTLRADCNGLSIVRMKLKCTFASTRSVQIATIPFCPLCIWRLLCLHTLRADCNCPSGRQGCAFQPLPPHAPCRLQQVTASSVGGFSALPPHAPCRLQHDSAPKRFHINLCLHTLRADCNGRNAQNCNMHFSERVLSW